MSFTLPKLEYSYDALEPFIDSKTMQVHYEKHHQAYIDKLNAAVKDTEFADIEINTLLKEIEDVPEKIRGAVINHGGGHANHSLFWQLLIPHSKSTKKPKDTLLKAIETKFGSFDKFKEQFTNTALNRFGSGWAWLIINRKKQLEIISTPNQDSPLMDGQIPLLGLDVWEHAYYLKYQNKRADYIEAFFNIINWEKVNELYINSKK
ncbi:MAG TPA: superoxide dismutase [Candidatus Nanoarchaeia archaeon]|nr:superoxide dismutase [Candidatus Nanoarchaeia archaeon]